VAQKKTAAQVWIDRGRKQQLQSISLLQRVLLHQGELCSEQHATKELCKWNNSCFIQYASSMFIQCGAFAEIRPISFRCPPMSFV
jgi:hypothetical protein